ncbi:MAG TPA: hypothetical protein VLB02_03000 [Candidatus Paceibacterota bacterium]|nr:hypothetical protein [Candidatus Paceibacterota bacterium]
MENKIKLGVQMNSSGDSLKMQMETPVKTAVICTLFNSSKAVIGLLRWQLVEGVNVANITKPILEGAPPVKFFPDTYHLVVTSEFGEFLYKKKLIKE